MTTKIGWTHAPGYQGETWNHVVGCKSVSDGCTACYAAFNAAGRLSTNPLYAGLATKKPGEPAKFTGEVRFVEDRLYKPLSWRTPRMVFVNSMSDLFHHDVPAGYVMRTWDVMGRCPQHVFQILTKRPKAMAGFTHRFADRDVEGEPTLPRGPEATRCAYRSGRGQLFAEMLDNMGTPPPDAAYPSYDWMEGMRWWPEVLDNVWLGSSIESDKYVFRARQVAAARARVHFLSLEPLLGDLPSLDLTGIEWVIVGGESGPFARPMHPQWVRAIRDRCAQGTECGECHGQRGRYLTPNGRPPTGQRQPGARSWSDCPTCHGEGRRSIPFFFKQWGAWRPFPDPNQDSREPDCWLHVDGRALATEAEALAAGGDWQGMYKLGAKVAGNRFDDEILEAWPDAV